jgi:hypothetical protein
VTLVYAAVLAWAGSLNASVSSGNEAQAIAGTQPVAGAITVAAGEVGEEIAAAAAEAPAEAPLVTLAIAAGMVALAGVAYGVHAFRARQPRLARSARLVVRHITTLH